MNIAEYDRSKFVVGVERGRIGRGRANVWHTVKGEMNTQELADIIGISVQLLNKRYQMFGLDSWELCKPMYSRHRSKGARPPGPLPGYTPSEANWRGLGSRPRNDKLKKLEGKTVSYFLDHAPDK